FAFPSPLSRAKVMRVDEGGIPLVTNHQASSDEQMLKLWLHGRSHNTQRAYRSDASRFPAWHNRIANRWPKAQGNGREVVRRAHSRQSAVVVAESGLERRRRIALAGAFPGGAGNVPRRISYRRYEPQAVVHQRRISQP